VLGADVQVGGVQVDVRERDVVELPGPERPDRPSRPAQILDTSLLEIPVPPSAVTRSSTERVETPWT
jgi:hypothetical protein